MTSLTQMAYASRVRRQGRSRRCFPNQPSRRRLSRRRTGSATVGPCSPGGSPREAVGLANAWSLLARARSAALAARVLLQDGLGGRGGVAGRLGGRLLLLVRLGLILLGVGRRG